MICHCIPKFTHPSCLNRAHRILVYFVSQKITAPPFGPPLLVPGGICPSCPLPATSVSHSLFNGYISGLSSYAVQTVSVASTTTTGTVSDKLADIFCMKFINSSTSSSVLSAGSFSKISWTVSRKTTAYKTH